MLEVTQVFLCWQVNTKQMQFGQNVQLFDVKPVGASRNQ
jgi:hypothetical protein